MDKPASESDRRRAPRADVCHPVKLKLFSRDLALPPTDGYVKDISIGGARVGLDDPYGQLSRKSLIGLRTKLQIALPESDTIQLICVVCWVKRSTAAGSSEVELGLQFSEMEPWQMDKVESFLSIRHNDQTMLWNMWDAYQHGEHA